MGPLTIARLLFVTPLLIALLPGVATGQVGGGGGSPFVCSVFTANTPTLRAESLTETVGDIVIVCTGGGFSRCRPARSPGQPDRVLDGSRNQPVAQGQCFRGATVD
jgi:hypothetical protein